MKEVEDYDDGMIEKVTNKVLFVYIISLFTVSDMPGLNTISNGLALLFILMVYIYIVAVKSKLIINSTMIFMLVFIFVCGLSYIVAIDKNLVISDLKTLVQIFILVSALVNYMDSEDKVKIVLKYHIYSATIVSIYVLLKSNITQGNRLGGVLGNENAVGMIVGIGLLLALYFIIYEKRYSYFILISFMCPVILLTGSRKAILMIPLSIFIILFLNSRKSFEKKLKFLLVALITLIILYFVIFTIPSVYGTLGVRLESLLNYLKDDGNIDSSIQQRDFMIRSGFDWFLDRPILGYGIANYRVLLRRAIYYEAYSHNNFIELLVGTGIMGMISFYLIYFDLLMKLIKHFNKSNVLIYVMWSLNFTIVLLGTAMVHYKSKSFFIILALSSVLTNNLMYKKAHMDEENSNEALEVEAFRDG